MCKPWLWLNNSIPECRWCPVLKKLVKWQLLRCLLLWNAASAFHVTLSFVRTVRTSRQPTKYTQYGLIRTKVKSSVPTTQTSFEFKSWGAEINRLSISISVLLSGAPIPGVLWQSKHLQGRGNACKGRSDPLQGPDGMLSKEPKFFTATLLTIQKS